MLTAASERVERATASHINERLAHEAEQRLEHYRQHPEQIDGRLRELDREWDVERFIETEAPTMSLFGLLLGMTGSRKWLLLPLAVQGFVLLHAVQGWYPLLPILRRLGYRTQQEIDAERQALHQLADLRGVRRNVE